jgi:hypothetical protein
MSEHTQAGLGQFSTDGDDDTFDPFEDVTRQTADDELGINPAPTLAQAPGIEDTGTDAAAIRDAVEADRSEKGTFGEKTESHELIRNDDGETPEDASFDMAEYTAELDAIVESVTA